MANINLRGIIIKQSDYGEGHRMLSIFAEDYGIIKAVNYRAKKSKSSLAASQFLCFGDFELYKGIKEIATVNRVDTQDGFYHIAEDVEKLSLCVYMADITYALLGNNNPDNDILRAFLNAVYALNYRDYSIDKVKAAYELKMMTLGGYMPNIDCCTGCGSGETFAFDIERGGMVCGNCMGKYSIRINEGVYKALRYIVCSDNKKMLSFGGNDALYKKLSEITEKYVSIQLDCQFKSLEYLKAIRQS